MVRFALTPGEKRREVSDEDWRWAVEAWRWLARRWRRRIPSWQDAGAYLGEMARGLARALREYDPEGGASFRRFAYHRMEQALVAESRRQDPAGARRRALLKQGLVEETPADLPPLSLDAILAEEEELPDDRETGPQPGPLEILLAREAVSELRAAVRTLEGRERLVIEQRYFLNRTQVQIAAELGVSNVTIHHVEKKALEKLKRIVPMP